MQQEQEQAASATFDLAAATLARLAERTSKVGPAELRQALIEVAWEMRVTDIQPAEDMLMRMYLAVEHDSPVAG